MCMRACAHVCVCICILVTVTQSHSDTVTLGNYRIYRVIFFFSFKFFSLRNNVLMFALSLMLVCVNASCQCWKSLDLFASSLGSRLDMQSFLSLAPLASFSSPLWSQTDKFCLGAPSVGGKPSGGLGKVMRGEGQQTEKRLAAKKREDSFTCNINIL